MRTVRGIQLDWATIGGVVVLTAALTYVVGPVGLAVGGLVAAVLGSLSLPVAIAIGHLALLVLVGPDLTLETIGIVEAGFAILIATRTPNRRTQLAALILVVGLVLLTHATIQTSEPLWVVAGVLTLSVAVLSYGLHRLELVKMGLVGGTP